MKTLGPRGAHARGGRAYLIAAATFLGAAALAGCGGGSTSDVATPGPVHAPAKPRPAPKPPPPPRVAASPKKAVTPEAQVVQARLVALGYLPAEAVTNLWDARTEHAVHAFQAWVNIARDGIVGPQTLAALERATRPTPASSLGGRHVEVHRDKGVTLLVENGRVVRALHSSSGGGAYSTPAGSYTVFRKELHSWSVPYRVWLPHASYFNNGIAFHGYADVPAYPASHGCVRLPMAEAPFAYAFMSIGTPVAVH